MLSSIEPFVFKLCLAVLPILPMAFGFREALFLSGLVGGSLLVTAFLFPRLQKWFPPKLQKFSIVLWLACLAQVAFYAFQQSPAWTLSVFLLLHFDGSSFECSAPLRFSSGPKPSSLFLSALGFGILLIFFVLFRIHFGGFLHLAFFHQVYGNFLFLSLIMLAARLLQTISSRGKTSHALERNS